MIENKSVMLWLLNAETSKTLNHMNNKDIRRILKYLVYGSNVKEITNLKFMFVSLRFLISTHLNWILYFIQNTNTIVWEQNP